MRGENISFVFEPRRIGWAVWGFVDGIFHALRHALSSAQFDYVQLLSPTCLPIKPMAAFEQYVSCGRFEANFGCVDLDRQRDALMSVGYRAFTWEGTFRHRVLRRMTDEYYKPSNRLRDIDGIQLRELEFPNDPVGGPVAGLRPRQWVALQAMRIARRGWVTRHPFRGDFIPCFGSTWFGATRSIADWIVRRFYQSDIQSYFTRVRIADEFLVPSLLRLSGARQGPSNTLINEFKGANPGWIDEGDLEMLRASPAFFARKFMDDPALPVRRLVLDELVHRADHADARPVAETTG